jgi:hypothetical protein
LRGIFVCATAIASMPSPCGMLRVQGRPPRNPDVPPRRCASKAGSSRFLATYYVRPVNGGCTYSLIAL